MVLNSITITLTMPIDKQHYVFHNFHEEYAKMITLSRYAHRAYWFQYSSQYIVNILYYLHVFLLDHVKLAIGNQFTAIFRGMRCYLQKVFQYQKIIIACNRLLDRRLHYITFFQELFVPDIQTTNYYIVSSCPKIITLTMRIAMVKKKKNEYFCLQM